jgi:hypothetical protein
MGRGLSERNVDFWNLAREQNLDDFITEDRRAGVCWRAGLGC